MNMKAKAYNKFRILVTPKVASQYLISLPPDIFKKANFYPTSRRIDDTDELISLLEDMDAVVLDLEQITAYVLSKCPRLKIISRFGEGCDSVDLGAARNFKVRVARTKGVASLAVARHTISLILATTHNIVENNNNLKRGLWINKPNLSEDELTAGVVGFGRIGRQVGRLLTDLGFRVIVFDHHKKSNKYKFTDLKNLIELSDIITLHLPLSSETERIISGDVIRSMRGKILVNTARGGLVDEKCLFDSLDNNGLKRYATDVFYKEPVSGVSKLLAKHPKVLSSPHVAALDRITSIKMTERAVINALCSLSGEHRRVISYVV